MANLFKDIKDKVFPIDDEDEDEEEAESTSKYEKEKNSKVRNVEAKMVVVEPRSFEEMQSVATHLLHKKAVVVNIHRLQDSNAQRLLDYLSGAVFAIGGSYQMIDKNVYLFSPNELPVDGVIESED